MFDWTWEEIYKRFSTLAEDRNGDMVGAIAQGMTDIIPQLQAAIEASSLSSIRVIKTMLSIELYVSTKRYLVGIYCEELGLYSIYIKKDWVVVKEEIVAYERVIQLVVDYLGQIQAENFEI